MLCAARTRLQVTENPALVGFTQNRGFQIQATPQSRAGMASPRLDSDPGALLGLTSLSGSLSDFFFGLISTSQAPLGAAAVFPDLTPLASCPQEVPPAPHPPLVLDSQWWNVSGGCPLEQRV